MSSFATPTRQHRHTPLRRSTLEPDHYRALDFCLVSPNPKVFTSREEFPFSPGVKIQTPPTPDTAGLPLLSPKSPALHVTPSRRLLRRSPPSSFERVLRTCQFPPPLRRSIERLGWIGEQVLQPPFKLIAEALLSLNSCYHSISDVQWMQLSQLRDATAAAAVAHIESELASHNQQQQVALPSTASTLLSRFLSIVKEIKSANLSSSSGIGVTSPTLPSQPPSSHVGSQQCMSTAATPSLTDVHTIPRIQSHPDESSTTIPAVASSSTQLTGRSGPTSKTNSRNSENAAGKSTRQSTSNSLATSNSTSTDIVVASVPNPSTSSAAAKSSPLSKRLQQHLKRECIKSLTKMLQTPVRNHEAWEGILTEDEILKSSTTESPTSATSHTNTQAYYLSSPIIRHAQKHLGDLWELMEEFGTGSEFIDAAVSGVTPCSRRKRRRSASRRSVPIATVPIASVPTGDVPTGDVPIKDVPIGTREDGNVTAAAMDKENAKVTQAKSMAVDNNRVSSVTSKKRASNKKVAKSSSAKQFGVLQCMGVKAPRKGKYRSMRAVVNKTKRTKAKKAKERETQKNNEENKQDSNELDEEQVITNEQSSDEADLEQRSAKRKKSTAQ